MFRISACALIILTLFLLLGCGGKPASVEEYGLELAFSNCYTFMAEVWIDDTYVGEYTSERSSLIEGVADGSHTLYAKSNIVVADSFFCWTTDFSMSKDKTTYLTLECPGHGCR
ncbi:MAG: hypothetical protein PHD74_02325 [Candidatus Krumholzibacteria bacterium]|nr:hypothetical protein [Candidatus Krumholzibacteria bacterium]